MHDFDQNTSKKKEEKILNFSQEFPKFENFQMLNPAIHLEW